MMSNENQNSLATLEYIPSMLRELRKLAIGQNEEMLGYLIDMAQLEASDRLTGNAGSSSKTDGEQGDSAA